MHIYEKKQIFRLFLRIFIQYSWLRKSLINQWKGQTFLPKFHRNKVCLNYSSYVVRVNLLMRLSIQSKHFTKFILINDVTSILTIEKFLVLNQKDSPILMIAGQNRSTCKTCLRKLLPNALGFEVKLFCHVADIIKCQIILLYRDSFQIFIFFSLLSITRKCTENCYFFH